MPYNHSTTQFDTGDLTEGTRRCAKCDKTKHISEYHWTGKKTGRRRKCKKCLVVEAKANRDANREKYRRYSYKWHLNSKYGLSLEEFDAILTGQDGSCKVCLRRFDLNDLNRKPHVDHCHATGMVRGILCFTCNTAIGKMQDNPTLLRRAADYLEA